MKASDIMTTSVVCIRADASILEAARLLPPKGRFLSRRQPDDVDVEALADRVVDALQNPQQHRHLATAARRRVVGEFAPAHATAALLHVFDEALTR